MFTMNMRDQMKIFTQFDFTIASDSFPLTCGLEFQVTAESVCEQDLNLGPEYGEVQPS
jgi:hypothetical protein